MVTNHDPTVTIDRVRDKEGGTQKRIKLNCPIISSARAGNPSIKKEGNSGGGGKEEVKGSRN